MTKSELATANSRLQESFVAESYTSTPTVWPNSDTSLSRNFFYRFIRAVFLLGE